TDGSHGLAFPDLRVTRYGIYSAITDYVDHYRPVRLTEKRGNMTENQVRAETALVGDGAEFKQKALTTLERILVLSDGSEAIETAYTSLPTATVPSYTPSNGIGLLDSILEATAK